LGLTLKEHYQLLEAFGFDIIRYTDLEVKNYIDLYNIKLQQEEQEQSE